MGASLAVVETFDNMGRDHFAAIRQHGIELHELHRRYGKPLTKRCRSDFNGRTHVGFSFFDVALRFKGQVDACILPHANAFEPTVVDRWLHGLDNANHSDVARIPNDVRKTDRSTRRAIGVTNRLAFNGKGSRIVKRIVKLNCPRFKGDRDINRFEGRSRLIEVGESPVLKCR